MTAALRALLPGAAVLVVAVVVLFGTDDATAQNLAGTYGLVVYGAGLALAWVFHRSRAFIALGVLAWLDIAVVGHADRIELLVALGTVVLGTLALLALMRDRGVGSRVGAAQVLGVTTLVATGGYLFSDPERVASFAARPELLPLEAVTWPGYPRVTLAVAVVALLAASWGFFRYRGPVERSLVWCAVLLLVAMHPEVGDAGSALFLVAAGLTVTIGIVETSYVMAYRDELTGLPGRRALMQSLDGLKGKYTIAMVDVDHFKKFNDRHGHDVGDQVLKLVASRLARVPGGGKAYRYGGEEFTLLFPGRVREDTLDHLEAVRGSVGDARFSIRSWKRPKKKPESGGGKKRATGVKHLSVTVSIGVADTTIAGSGAEDVLKKADQALYRAKKKGRDQVSK